MAHARALQLVTGLAALAGAIGVSALEDAAQGLEASQSGTAADEHLQLRTLQLLQRRAAGNPSTDPAPVAPPCSDAIPFDVPCIRSPPPPCFNTQPADMPCMHTSTPTPDYSLMPYYWPRPSFPPTPFLPTPPSPPELPFSPAPHQSPSTPLPNEPTIGGRLVEYITGIPATPRPPLGDRLGNLANGVGSVVRVIGEVLDIVSTFGDD